VQRVDDLPSGEVRVYPDLFAMAGRLRERLDFRRLARTGTGKAETNPGDVYGQSAESGQRRHVHCCWTCELAKDFICCRD